MSALGFYTYEHTRNDTGAVFYVGKGRGRRAGSIHGRNQYWKRIVAKAGGFAVRIIADGLDEEVAHLVEVERIDQCRRIGMRLANITNGGDGASGCVPSQETRQKMRMAHIGKPSPMRGKKSSAETKAKLSAIHAGKPKSEKHKRKISAAHMGKSMPVVVCPHCLKEGDVGNMSRWHFDNCKHKEI